MIHRMHKSRSNGSSEALTATTCPIERTVFGYIATRWSMASISPCLHSERWKACFHTTDKPSELTFHTNN